VNAAGDVSGGRLSPAALSVDTGPFREAIANDIRPTAQKAS